MSNLVKCLFYYGPGEVVVNEHGADLGEFRWSELELSDPETWSISQLKDWLAACLGLNPQTDTVGVHALWTKTRSPVFFLFEADRTDLSDGAMVARLRKQGMYPYRVTDTCREGGDSA